MILMGFKHGACGRAVRAPRRKITLFNRLTRADALVAVSGLTRDREGTVVRKLKAAVYLYRRRRY